MNVGDVLERSAHVERINLVMYAGASGDFNPIHINPYFADFAALPGTITHGMWSSAATRRYVEVVAAQGHPERVIS